MIGTTSAAVGSGIGSVTVQVPNGQHALICVSRSSAPNVSSASS